MKDMIELCLNDYTIDQRGDVGSKVRIEAINTVSIILKHNLLSVDERRDLAVRVCGLAVEKLDKVRSQAIHCLQSSWDILGVGDLCAE